MHFNGERNRGYYRPVRCRFALHQGVGRQGAALVLKIVAKQLASSDVVAPIGLVDTCQHITYAQITRKKPFWGFSGGRFSRGCF
ncbi:MAG: hypothetical protein ACI83P_002559 [Janthinobacterium sp.]|jgi:hypothetical protein